MAWRSPKIGVIPVLLVLFPIFKTSFNVITGIDFVVTRYNDPDWIKTVADWVLNPSLKSNLVIFSIGVAWLLWLWRPLWFSRFHIPLVPSE